MLSKFNSSFDNFLLNRLIRFRFHKKSSKLGFRIFQIWDLKIEKTSIFSLSVNDFYIMLIDIVDFDGRLAVNKKGAATTKGGRKPAKGKEPKDPNKPKRPPSAFFVFM